MISNSPNDSNEDIAQDDILIRRGTRPKRRRLSPTNLRPQEDLVLLVKNPSSTELEESASTASTIHQADFAASSAPLRSFNSSQTSVLDSKRRYMFPGLTNPEIPLDDTSVLDTNGSNSWPKSWVHSQDATQRMRQAGDDTNGGENKSQSGNNSTKKHSAESTSTQSVRNDSITSTSILGQIRRSIPTRSQQREETRKRKEALEKMQSKLNQTQKSLESSVKRDWQTEQSAENPPDNSSVAVSSQPPPKLSLPSVSVPKVSLPPVSEPKVSLPPVSKPKVSLPPVPEPKVSLAPLFEPKVSLPPVSEPKVSLPPVFEPKVSLLPVSEPKVSVTPLSEPKVSLPPATDIRPPPLSFPAAGKRSKSLLNPSDDFIPVKRISSPIKTKGSVSTANNSYIPSSSLNSSFQHASPNASSVFTTPTPSITAYHRKEETLTQRFLATVTSRIVAVSVLCSLAVQKLTDEGPAENDFEDDVKISSDEEDDNSTSIAEEEDQMDSEWLDLSDFEIYEDQIRPVISSSELLINVPSVHSVTSNKRLSAYHYPLKFLYVMFPIYDALFYLGRFPFKIDFSEDIPVYKLNRLSCRYFLFIGTSLLTTIVSLLMVANLITIATLTDPLTIHETILRLEQEKYWIAGTLEVVNMIFIAVSSVSLLKYGGFLVDYLNRWSQSVSIIRYDVTSGLRNMANSFFWIYGIYAVVIIILFLAGGENVPTVRGMCGFTGILILNTFASEIRLRPGFRAVEYFGLFVHLYVTLAGSLIIVVISMQCWALNNAAIRFNRRLATCLRGVGFRSPESVPPASRLEVPYTKLFAEHLVVTSFPTHIGKTFSFTFVVYLGCKMAEMILTLFGVAEPIVNGFHESNETFFDVYSQSHHDPELVTPIMIVEPRHIQSIKCGLYVAKTWLPWFIFMEIVQRPGTSIIRGSNLIVKNGYIRCKNTHALRFIASMEFSFSNRAAFFVNPGVQVTRAFTGKFVGFALAIFLTLLQFIPAEVNTQSVVICDHFGDCARFQFPGKSRSHDGYQKSIGKIISEERHATTPKPFLPPPVYENDFNFAPCVYGGLLPVNQSASFGFNCSHNEDSVFIPTYFKKSSNKFIQIPPTPEHSCVNSSELPLNETLFDCYGDEVKVIKLDECGNPMVPTTDLLGNKRLPDLRVVKFNSSEIFCCYAYGGLENQSEMCNLMSTETGNYKCTRKSKTADRQKYEESISALWDEPDEDVFPKMRDWWTQCLCQGLESIPISTSICAASIDLDGPCLAYPLTRDPCKHCLGSPRKMFKEHFLYRCSVEGSLPKNNRIFALPTPVKFMKDSTDSTQPVPWGYPCEKQATILDRSQEEGVYQDCYGQQVKMQGHEYKDDCGTRKLSFPDRFTGKMVLPTVKVVKFDGGVPSFPGAFFSFVCCWNYEEWQESEVDSKCNLYPGSDLSKVCSFRIDTSEAEAIRRCNDIVNGSKLYVEKCVDGNGKAFNTCRN